VIPDYFVYGSETIGGSAPTHGTEVLDAFHFVTTEDDAEYVCRFVVRVVPSGNATTDFNALNAACQAVESALRMRYQKLTVSWGVGNAVEIFDPSTTDGATQEQMGFSAEPTCQKLGDFPNSGEARGYEFRVKVGRPPNYTDTYGPAAGRRQVDVSFHFDLNQRLVATVSGVWTQVPSALARNQFLSQIDSYVAYRLSLLANAGPVGGLVTVAGTSVTGSGTSFLQIAPGTVVWFGSQPGTSYTVSGSPPPSSDTSLTLNGAFSGPSGSTSMIVGQWAITARDESDPNDLSVLRFTRTYGQHVFGRLDSDVNIFYGPQKMRTVTIRGSCVRTMAGSQYGSANSALANFLDSTNGGQAYAEATTLPNLAASQGGPLTVGQDCYLLTTPTVEYKEQQDRVDYTLVYQELIQQQSLAAAPYLNDPNIRGDTIVVGVSFQELDDTPEPPAVSSLLGPNGEAPQSAQASNPGPLTTQDNSSGSLPNPGTIAGSGPGTQASATPAVKPVTLLFNYQAYFDKDNVTDCYAYWVSHVKPLLYQVLVQEFALGQGSELVILSEKTDRTKNQVTADGQIRAYSANVVNFLYTQGNVNDLGVRADAAFAGTPHAYLVQQGLPRSTMTRVIQAIYKTGTYDLTRFVTPPSLGPGWVPLRNATPKVTNRIKGIPQQGIQTQPLTYAELNEDLLWVAVNVATAGGGSSTTGGGGSSPGIPVTTGGGDSGGTPAPSFVTG